MSVVKALGLACCVIIILGATVATLAALYWLLHELYINTYRPHHRKEDH